LWEGRWCAAVDNRINRWSIELSWALAMIRPITNWRDHRRDWISLSTEVLLFQVLLAQTLDLPSILSYITHLTRSTHTLTAQRMSSVSLIKSEVIAFLSVCVAFFCMMVYHFVINYIFNRELTTKTKKKKNRENLSFVSLTRKSQSIIIANVVSSILTVCDASLDAIEVRFPQKCRFHFCHSSALLLVAKNTCSVLAIWVSWASWELRDAYGGWNR